ncbi:MAG: 50S ribosomal protein L32e [Promethearchaeota archaeon]|nr:MAG: 50S ribosomal protein L32e [Candidatus Lokiarchaeota archaeon]
MEHKRLFEIRKKMKKQRPSFNRVESWRYKRVKPSWRKARGIDSKTRRKNKAGVKSPSVGYRTPKKIRGIHPSGYQEVRVFTIKDLDTLNKNKHALKISSRLGAKKRIMLVEAAQRKGFKVLNLGISQQELESFESMLESSLEEEDYVDVDELDED